jgi:hypothetical protein
MASRRAIVLATAALIFSQEFPDKRMSAAARKKHEAIAESVMDFLSSQAARETESFMVTDRA